MENVETAPTARETIAAAFDAVESAQSSQIGAETPASSKIAENAEETQQQKEDRVRDEAGRFAKAETVAAPQAQKPASATLSSGAPHAPAVAAPEVPRPTSWKKDYDTHWSALAPEVKSYILQREKEYQSGVSAYKAEAESARKMNEAIAPFMPLMQQHGVEPTTLVQNLISAHERLALGSPQDKVMMGAKLIHDYGIDPQQLLQVLSGQVPYQQPQAPQRPAPQQPDVKSVVAQVLMEEKVNQEYQRFITEAPEKYPHYEAVKDTMAGLLQAELAQDYVSAYEAALRMPKHADIWNAMQEQQRAQDEANARAQSQAVVSSARNRAVSVKPATPSGPNTSGKANPSLHDSVSEAFDTVMSSRV